MKRISKEENDSEAFDANSLYSTWYCGQQQKVLRFNIQPN